MFHKEYYPGDDPYLLDAMCRLAYFLLLSSKINLWIWREIC